MRTRRVAALTTVLLALAASLAALPAGAVAAEVGTTEPFCPKGCIEEATVELIAAPGETNRVTVTQTADGFLVHDAGAPLTATRRCTAVDANTVRCTPEPGATARIALGDGDDEVTLRTAGLVDGGPGADRVHADGTAAPLSFVGLEGREGDDRLIAAGAVAQGTISGSEGADVLDAAGATGGLQLDGGDGDDQLAGTASDDVLAPGAGADTVDGGAGRDRFSHADRAAPLLLALRDGRSAEDPVVTGIEDVTGGRGADRIGGDDGPNELDGGPGPDWIVCGGARDLVHAGTGDRLPVPSIEELGSSPLSPVATDCETLAFPAYAGELFCLALDRVRRDGRRLRVPDPCEGPGTWLYARAAELRTVRGGRLAEAIVKARRRPLSFALTPAGRAALGRADRADVRVRVGRIYKGGRRGAPTTVRVALEVR